jgi:hypothetical protein
MSTAVLTILALVALALLGWLVFSVSRKKAFAPSDIIALLGLVVTLLVAVVPFALSEPAEQTVTPSRPVPQVRIEGPDIAPLGRQTYFTIISSNARRAEWSIGGFTGDEAVIVDPLPPSHAIFVEPTDASRAGESFTIAVTIYAADDQTMSATKKFVVTR